MIPRIRKSANWVYYPWFVTLYPIIHLYGGNMSSVRKDDVWEVIGLALAITTVLFVLCYLLLRDVHKVGAMISVAALEFLTYGHLYNAIEDIAWACALLLPVMLILALMAIVLIWRSKTFWRQFTPYVNGIFLVLLVLASWPVADFWVNRPAAGATALVNPFERVVSTPILGNSPERPDIYFLILDGYSSNEFWLRENGYDNSAFTDALEEWGFYVAYDSQSSYAETLSSLSTTLNMRYITDADRNLARSNRLYDNAYLRSLIANSRVAYDLKQLGYHYVYMMSGHLSPSALADTNVVFYPDGPEYFSGSEFYSSGSDGYWAYQQPFWSFFLETTLLRPVASRLELEDRGQPYGLHAPELVLATFEELERIPAMAEATFTFAHIIKPHEPIGFDRDGNIISHPGFNHPDKARYFFDELYFLNTRVLELVDHLLSESSVPPIIIIQGDHGTNLGSPFVSENMLRGYFSILNALYLPGNGASELLDPAIPAINTFRLIFNQYFDGDYEQLPLERYTQPNAWWLEDYFTRMPLADDRRLNVGLGDHIVLLYNGEDANGAPEFHIYDVAGDGQQGALLFIVTRDDLATYLESAPAQNTLIVRQGAVAFYALTTGEFQFNIGPDTRGREWAVIVDDLPAWVIYGYEVGAD